MGTRSGNIDPMVLQYLNRSTLLPYDDIFHLLNHESGLLGVSGISSNMEQVLQSESDDQKNAVLAVQLFCRGVTKLIGSYMALLGGADRIVFGGGIGTNSPTIRQRILHTLAGLGIIVDAEANSGAVGRNCVISQQSSPTTVVVIDDDEESIILSEVRLQVAANRQPP